MEKKKSFGTKLEAFFAGKGFYIVLFLCVAVIGVSAWSMLSGTGTDVELSDDMDISFAGVSEADSIPAGLTEYPVINEKPLSTESEAPAAKSEEIVQPAPTPQSTPAPSAPADAAPSASYFIWPVSGEIDGAYSMTSLSYSNTMHDWRTHDGIDIAAQLGTHVKATADGIVEDVYADDLYGTTVIMSHGGGLKSVYSNLASTPTVGKGDAVAMGEVIGSVGDTALCEAAQVTHLHFAMSLNGESVDPTEYMP